MKGPFGAMETVNGQLAGMGGHWDVARKTPLVRRLKIVMFSVLYYFVTFILRIQCILKFLTQGWKMISCGAHMANRCGECDLV